MSMHGLQRKWLQRAGISLIALLLVLPLLAPTQACSAEAKRRLYRIFGVSPERAHYVIAVDTSLSMKEKFGKVTPALKVLAGLTNKEDRVSLITFDREARLLWSGKASNRKKLTSLFSKKPNKRGTSTDIGAGIKKALRRVWATPEDLQVVFFITDGVDEPPAASEFAGGSFRPWAELARKSKAIKGKVIKVYGIGLDSRRTDVALLGRVFKDVSKVSLRSEQLGAYFSGLKAELREAKLRAKLKAELAHGGLDYRLEPSRWKLDSRQRARGNLLLISRYDKLSVAVRDLRIDLGTRKVGGVDVVKTRSGLSRVTIGPGKRIKVPVVVTVRRPKGPWRLGLRGSTIPFSVKMSGEMMISPYTEIRSLGFSASAKRKYTGDQAALQVFEGLPYTYAAAAALGAALVALGLYRAAILPGVRFARRLAGPPPLFGRLTFVEAPEGQRRPAPIKLSGRGSSLVLGKEGDVILPGIETASAELLARWEGSRPVLSLRKRSGIIRMRASRPQPAKQVLDETDLKKGSIIDIEGYKVQWL